LIATEDSRPPRARKGSAPATFGVGRVRGVDVRAGFGNECTGQDRRYNIIKAQRVFG